MTAGAVVEQPHGASEEGPGDSARWIELRTMSRANWTWLVDLPDEPRTLELAAPGSSLPGALAGAHAPIAHHLLPAVLPLPGRDASLDCVIVHDGLAGLAGDDALLADCARVLRRGGWLYASGDNPLAVAALRRDARCWVGSLRRQLLGGWRAMFERAARAAGFVEVRLVYAWPAIDAPRMLIPATRVACAAHEHLERKHSNRGSLRARLARLGLHPLLYPAEVLLCRR